MRENKFRGKRVDNGEWEYGDLYQQSISSWLGNEEKKFLIHRLYSDEWNGQVNYEVIPETVGQFTGEVTFNKQEIYEHDIIRDCNGEEWEVKFEDGKFICDSDDSQIDLHEVSWEAEIIGTIHDKEKL